MSADCTITIDGVALTATEGVPLGSVLHTLGPGFRLGVNGHLRGLYCGMGVCFECLVSVDGRRVRACLTPVREGMMVVTGDTP